MMIASLVLFLEPYVPAQVLEWVMRMPQVLPGPLQSPPPPPPPLPSSSPFLRPVHVLCPTLQHKAELSC